MNGFVQMSLLSLTGMLVKREPRARLPIKRLKSCSIISSAKKIVLYCILVTGQRF